MFGVNACCWNRVPFLVDKLSDVFMIITYNYMLNVHILFTVWVFTLRLRTHFYRVQRTTILCRVYNRCFHYITLSRFTYSVVICTEPLTRLRGVKKRWLPRQCYYSPVITWLYFGKSCFMIIFGIGTQVLWEGESLIRDLDGQNFMESY